MVFLYHLGGCCVIILANNYVTEITFDQAKAPKPTRFARNVRDDDDEDDDDEDEYDDDDDDDDEDEVEDERCLIDFLGRGTYLLGMYFFSHDSEKSR